MNNTSSPNLCVVSSFSGIDWKNYVCHYMKLVHKKQYDKCFLNGNLAKNGKLYDEILFCNFFL